ncbi:MFS transporter [Psychromonas sp. Urea-02u-13]|uniref:MFS transporter n=1 Tax=Psychromonas sp. Urea-02u-13 TaxID=2058326 RepID=UPI000C33F1BE|nr:MFS transporter [Psychromonas sp. Urea-02u-13]PKG38830.1 MFS transporter [Psychromonas sp. Urea-02u-13]
MIKVPFNVWLLMCVGALAMSAASIVVFTGGIIGSALAPSETLATLPLALMIVGTALAVIPVTMLMQRFGRKRVFILGTCTSIVGSLVTCVAIMKSHFELFCFGTFLLGAGLAYVQQYRFAAMESVSPDQMASAAAKVLLGGLAAAIIGPELALLSKDMFAQPFAGAYLSLAGLYLLATTLLFLYRPNHIHSETQTSEGRPLTTIIKQPVFWVALLAATVGYAVMSFIMTATPMSMHIHDGHSLADTKWVIQSHIMAMFIPSFFSGFLIRRYGVAKMMMTGVLAFVLCAVIALIDRSLLHYWIALILLGIGWNFLFVSGTSLLPQSYKDNERFKVQALNEFSVFSIQALASLSSGWVLYQFGWEILIYISLPMLLVVVMAIYYWQRGQVKGA